MRTGSTTPFIVCLIGLPFVLIGFGVLGGADLTLWIGLGVLAALAGFGLLWALSLSRRQHVVQGELERLQQELTSSHKDLEQKRETIRLFKGATRSAKLGYFAWDLQRDSCIDCSDEYAALHGLSREKYLSGKLDTKSDAFYVHPDDRKAYLKACALTLKERRPLDIQYRIVSVDGRIHHVHEVEFNFTTKHGRPYRSEGMIQDITDLRRSETLLLAAMNASSTVFAIFAPDDRLLLANPAYVLLFGDRSVPVEPGMPYEQIVRKTAAAGSLQGSSEEVEAWVQARLSRRENPAKGMMFQSESGRWFEVQDVILEDGHVFTMGADITERRTMEMRLQEAQRMEAVGQLAAGMAHDFNNLLGIIHGNAELLGDKSGEDAEMLEAIQRASRRAAELTQNLLAFSRRQPLRPENLEPGPLVEEIVTEFARTLPVSIRIEVEIAPSLPPLRADPSQLENAMINLMLNAVQAMPKGGLLRITCEPLSTGSEQHSNLARDQDYLRITVADSGLGMEPEVLAQAFQPFFSTGKAEHHSGLGLSMVYGFATQSEGRINIDSRPREGTEACLILPAAPRSKKVQTAPSGRASGEAEPGDGEGILVLDDNKAVRAVLRAQLSRLGYEVHQAETIGEAAQILNNEAIDLALVDIMLSDDCSGPEFVAEAHKAHPALPVIYISGYSAERAPLDPGTPLLTKPFTRALLARTVSAALRKAPQDEVTTA